MYLGTKLLIPLIYSESKSVLLVLLLEKGAYTGEVGVHA